MKTIATLTIGVVTSLLLIETSLAGTWIVSPNGKTDFNNIQAAINAASDGDEILVYPGTYNEHINYSGKTLIIRSTEGSESTIIDGQNNAPALIRTIGGELPGTSLEGFTITNGRSGGITGTDGAGIYVEGSASFRIVDCVIQNCVAPNGAGAAVLVKLATTEERVFSMTGTTVKDSSATHWGGLADFRNSFTDTTIENCIFTNGTSWNGSISAGWMVGPDESYGETNFIHCSFINCDGSKFGIIAHCVVNFDGCIFEQNHASGWNGWTGDAIAAGWFGWSEISITNSVFFDNGGPVVSSQSEPDDICSISDSLFCSNSTPNINGNWSVENVQELESCPEFLDCNEDGIADWIQVITHPEMDTNNNGIPDNCETQFGACCINGYAIELYDNDCDYVSGEFMGGGSDPTDVTCSIVCTEDVNGDGVVNIYDILAILDVWGTCP